ncbi:MAG: DinB family protein [candidate division Zixibacteria bacterium]|nr:DinB family protein [candidate division Zixibacteria bacterium]
MHSFWKALTWSQFGAAIDTLKNAINTCPDELWGDQTRFHQFWYMAYHTLFYLDFYLSADVENFNPKEPFTLSELDPSGVLPDRVYSKAEMLDYLAYGRKKCHETIMSMTEERAQERFVFGSVDLNVAETLLYTMRHVQHHSAQLNMILRQETDSAPGWIFTAG